MPPLHRTAPLGVLLGASLALVPAFALAHDPPADPPSLNTAGSDDEVDNDPAPRRNVEPMSDQEMRELMEAIEADAQTTSPGEADVRASDSTPNSDGTHSATLGHGQHGATGDLDIALILDVAAAYFTADDPLQAGAHDPQRTGFTMQQLELSLAGSVDPFFRFDANIVFAEFGVEVEEATATTSRLPGRLQLKAGQFLTPFGRLNRTHPHEWSFVDQPLLNGRFLGGEGSRGLGLEVSWLAPTSWYAELTAAANHASGACCARSFYGDQDRGVDGLLDLLYTLNLRQFFELSDDLALYWGLSAQLGPNPTGQDNRSAIYGTDLYLRFRPRDATQRSSITLQAESMVRTRQVPGDALMDWGLYSQLVWQLNQSWEVGARYEFISGVEDDPLDPDVSAPLHRAALQGTFYPSHFSRVRLQPSISRGSEDDGSTSPEFGIVLALEIVAGAHGTHEY